MTPTGTWTDTRHESPRARTRSDNTDTRPRLRLLEWVRKYDLTRDEWEAVKACADQMAAYRRWLMKATKNRNTGQRDVRTRPRRGYFADIGGRMTLPEPLRSLPDSTTCYVPGVGEVTLGQVRATEEKPALEEEWPATLRMYARKATDHYTAKGTVAGEWRWSVGRKGVNRVTVYGREKQSGTTGQTLDRIYVQDDMPPKVRLAHALARRLGDG